MLQFPHPATHSVVIEKSINIVVCGYIMLTVDSVVDETAVLCSQRVQQQNHEIADCYLNDLSVEGQRESIDGQRECVHMCVFREVREAVTERQGRD